MPGTAAFVCSAGRRLATHKVPKSGYLELRLGDRFCTIVHEEKSYIAMNLIAKMALRIIVVSLAACASSVPSAWAQDKPNIVLMVQDNLGWGEIGTYGGGILRGAETPRLDALADEGLKLLNFNVEAQCVPSRSALMTGRHPIRSGTHSVVWGMLYGMTQWEETIAELLSDHGYATGMYGKWHLGDVE